MQKSHQPQWDPVLIPGFDIILKQIRIINIPDLPGIFILTTDFYNIFLIDQKVGMYVQKYLMIYGRLV